MITEIHRWSSRGIPPAAAYAAWGEAVDAHFHQYHYSSADPERFSGAFVRRGIGALAFTAFYLSASEARYEPVRKAEGDHRFELKYICRGSARLSSDLGEEELRPSALVLLDHMMPFRFASGAGVECAALSFPGQWLESAVPDVAARCFQVADPGAPWSNPLGALMQEVASLPAGDHRIPETLVADTARGLLELLYGAGAAEATPHRQQLARAIIREIAAHYHDPELRVDDVARRCHISRRHLHGVLASAGTSFGKELTRIRLTRAKAMLESPGYHMLHISQIAYRCGFSDAAHFSRRFAQTYGASPSAARQTMWAGRGN